jgi:hypothetical protein
MSGIFISHTHSDKPIADGLASLAGALFGDRLPVNYSSKKELEAALRPGRIGSAGLSTRLDKPMSR